MNYFEEIVEFYKKKFNDDLSDLNSAQINRVVSLAYEVGHSTGIEECADYMSDYVNLVRDVLKMQSK